MFCVYLQSYTTAHAYIAAQGQSVSVARLLLTHNCTDFIINVVVYLMMNTLIFAQIVLDDLG